jgi:DNA polymerase-3 subunit gamma/tau
MDLTEKYRPKKLKDIVGQASAVQVLEEWVKRDEVPHALLLSGPSGTGKTTAARILRNELGCGDDDFQEINAASTRGIDTVREIERRMRRKPWNGKCLVYLWDEAHMLTRRKSGDAQTALLKVLEGTPSHVYFFLCTTDPNELLRTVRGRCASVEFRALSLLELRVLIEIVSGKEKIEVSDELVVRIAEAADGSAREAHHLLDKVRGIEGEEDRLSAVIPTGVKHLASEVALGIIYRRAKWPQVAALLKQVDEDPERFRRLVLAIATTELLKAGKNSDRAALVVSAFECDFFSGGRASLVRACYECCIAK